MASSTAPVWLITGVSSGIGLALAREALSHGHRVVGSVRSTTGHSGAAIAELESRGGKCVQMDMNAGTNSIEHATNEALKIHGRIDVLVNNAGYAVIGAVEDIPDAESRRQLETNFFGPVALTKAVLPAMRTQRSGVVVNISSTAGLNGLPSCGLYAASKFALEGFSESLAREVAPFGIRVLIIEPGTFRTDFQARLKYVDGREIGEAYRGGPVQQVWDGLQGVIGNQVGAPEKGASIIVRQVIQVAKEDRTDVKRVLLGSDAVQNMQEKIGLFSRDLAAGEADARSADFKEG